MGVLRRIEVEEVQCAMNHMKIVRKSIPFGVAIEQFRVGGDRCLKPLRNILMISC